MNNQQLQGMESSWLCSMSSLSDVVSPPFSIHSMVYEWLISHNFQFFTVCNNKKVSESSVQEGGLESLSSSSTSGNPNHFLIILLCLILCLCLVSFLDKIKSFLKSIPNRAIDNDNQTLATQSSNTFYEKIINYSMVLIHERRIGLIITTIGLFVFAFFVLSHKTDEQVILLIKSNKNYLSVTLNQTVSDNSTLSSSTPLSISQNTTTNNLLETNSTNNHLPNSQLTDNSVNTNVHNTSPITKHQQLYISLVKSTWIEMQLQNQLKVGTVTMKSANQPDTFLESALKAILNIALLALKFFYIYLAMIGLILLLRWLTLGSLSGMSTHPIGMAPPLVPTIPNASLHMNFASP